MKLIDKILASLTQEERRVLLERIAAGAPAADIAEALTKNGYPCGKTTIKEFRRSYLQKGVMV